VNGGSPVIRVAVAQFPPTLATVSQVRVSTVRTLADWSVDVDAVQAAELIVDELAANAVAASGPDDFVAVRLTATHGKVLIEVWDHTETGPRLTRPGEDSEHGRGLLLVDAMAASWSWYPAKSGGKVIWAQIPATMRTVPPGTGAPMPARTPGDVPAPRRPVHYNTDPETLRRVAERLHALDDWTAPHPSERPGLSHADLRRKVDGNPDEQRRIAAGLAAELDAEDALAAQADQSSATGAVRVDGALRG